MLSAKWIPQVVRSAFERVLRKHSLTTSQAGQDYWIYGEAFNEKRNGYFVDVGAHDGIYLSNSYLLESRYDWTGICVEANPRTFAQLRKNRRAVCLNICLDRSIGEVSFVLRGVLGGIVDRDVDNKNPDTTDEIVKLKTTTLLDVLEEHRAPREIDYLSIDTEGAEERILAGFDFDKYIFRCITIERPTRRLRDLLRHHGYILVREIPRLDRFYVHRTFLRPYGKNLTRFYRKKRLEIHWG